MRIKNDQKKKGTLCAQGIADWLCRIQSLNVDSNPAAGSIPWVINAERSESQANNWNMAFAIMGLLAAYKAFNNDKYEHAALNMGRYLKTLQIFERFNKKHYGAIREISPQTPWCYTRDALSAAWAFIVLFQHTGDKEYLERARLWGEWFFEYGLDKEGWPLWGIQFEPYFKGGRQPQMRNDIQGSFQGGSLNFLYHLGRIDNNPKWTGEKFIRIADHLTEHIQQDSGLFASIDRTTKKPPQADPQKGLHQTNDDLSTLGLLAAYKVTNKRYYLHSIEKYLTAVFKMQKEDGSFGQNIASIPVILNILYESESLVSMPAIQKDAVEKAINRLITAQSDGIDNPRMAGGLIETPDRNEVCARSSCYALIYLLKLCAGVDHYLSV